MSAKGKRLYAVLWCGVWGAIMFPAGAGNLVMRRFMPPSAPFDLAWMEPLAWSYLFLGPFVVVASWRLNAGRRWPRFPLQGFLAFMLVAIASTPFLMSPILTRMFAGLNEAPAFFKVFAGLILLMQAAMFIAFLGLTFLALRCLRSEEVRFLASAPGF